MKTKCTITDLLTKKKYDIYYDYVIPLDRFPHRSWRMVAATSKTGKTKRLQKLFWNLVSFPFLLDDGKIKFLCTIQRDVTHAGLVPSEIEIDLRVTEKNSLEMCEILNTIKPR